MTNVYNSEKIQSFWIKGNIILGHHEHELNIEKLDEYENAK